MTVTHKTKCGEYESSLVRQYGGITADSFGRTTADSATRELLNAKYWRKENERIALIGINIVKKMLETIETKAPFKNKWKVSCNGYLHPREFREVLRQFQISKSKINLPNKESRSFYCYREDIKGRTVLVIINRKRKKTQETYSVSGQSVPSLCMASEDVNYPPKAQMKDIRGGFAIAVESLNLRDIGTPT